MGQPVEGRPICARLTEGQPGPLQRRVSARAGMPERNHHVRILAMPVVTHDTTSVVAKGSQACFKARNDLRMRFFFFQC